MSALDIMPVTRRGFMGSLLAMAAAPAIVKADSLMAVKGFIIPQKELILPGQQKIITQTLEKGSRLYTVNANSMAYLEAQADGLVEFRRIGDNVQFILTKIDPINIFKVENEDFKRRTSAHGEDYWRVQETVERAVRQLEIA